MAALSFRAARESKTRGEPAPPRGECLPIGTLKASRYAVWTGALRSARLPVNLIGSPIKYTNRLIGSPITSQSTGLDQALTTIRILLVCICPPYMPVQHPGGLVLSCTFYFAHLLSFGGRTAAVLVSRSRNHACFISVMLLPPFPKGTPVT
jgi:hypothetical protein